MYYLMPQDGKQKDKSSSPVSQTAEQTVYTNYYGINWIISMNIYILIVDC